MVAPSTIYVGPKRVGDSVIIVAEAGVNHNGSLRRALTLVDAAAKAGADAAKFQTFHAEHIASASAPKARYQEKAGLGKSQLDMLGRLELSREDFVAISQRARKRGITFLSTPGDEDSVDLLEELDVPAFKIGSGELTNIPFLTYVAKKHRPIILSTGMSYLEEVEHAVATIRDQGNNEIVLLHCTSSYPAKTSDANLRAIVTLRDAFHLPVGFSDHTETIEASLAAVALGAVLIEKHFTLSHQLRGPDHQSSLEPDDFRRLVDGIRVVEESLGNPTKVPTPAEQEMRSIARRSVVASKNIHKGTVIESDMLVLKRPGTGIPPSDLPRVMGRRAKQQIKKDEVLTWDMLK